MVHTPSYLSLSLSLPPLLALTLFIRTANNMVPGHAGCNKKRLLNCNNRRRRRSVMANCLQRWTAASGAEKPQWNGMEWARRSKVRACAGYIVDRFEDWAPNGPIVSNSRMTTTSAAAPQTSSSLCDHQYDHKCFTTRGYTYWGLFVLEDQKMDGMLWCINKYMYSVQCT